MKDSQTSYRQIMKATSLFGGVQIFNIIIAVIRSKFVAVLLGPAGIGIVGLLANTIGLVGSITNFGLGTSSVKNIAEANSAGDKFKVARVVGVFRKLVWATGLLGAVVVFVSSSWLSEITFGNQDFKTAFIWLSITLLLNQLSSGQMVLLQGMQRIKLLAKSSLLGSIAGLFTIIPIYYVYGMDGIVPVFIVTSSFSLLLSYYFSRKIRIEKVALNIKTIFTVGKSMLVMGFLIGLTGIMDQLIAYITRIFISNQGDIEIVGLYTAGFVIVNTYVGMVFNAMLTDYYPRLSAVSKDNKLSKIIINQQSEIAVLILAPLVILFLVFIKGIIIILYSDKFISIDKMIYWAMIGVLFKALNWAIGIIVLAKGDSKKYFVIYIAATLIILTTNIGGYHFFGLEGLGIAFFATNFLLIFINYGVARHYYSYSFSAEIIRIFTIQFSLSFVCFIIVQTMISPFNYIFGVILMAISTIYSYKELDKRLDLRSLLNGIRNRFK